MRKVRRGIAAFALTMVFVSGGVALAAWTASAINQNGYSKYGSLQAVTTVDISATVTGSCFPGTTCDLELRFSNPNPQAVTVTTVDASAATFTGLGTCTTPAASISGSTTITVNGALPGSGTLNYSSGGKIAIGAGASSDCQSQVLRVGGLVVNTTT